MYFGFTCGALNRLIQANCCENSGQMTLPYGGVRTLLRSQLSYHLSVQPRAHVACVRYGEEGSVAATQSQELLRTNLRNISRHFRVLPQLLRLHVIYRCLSADSTLALWVRPTKPEGITASFSSFFPMR
jgi:hypothetical protein